MLSKYVLQCCLVLLCFVNLQSQVSYTANDKIPDFIEPFGYGSNMGYFPGWSDEDLADIAIGNSKKGIAGAGVTCLRPALFEHFLEKNGYDFRLSTFQYYQELGAKNNVAFIGFPSEEHRDPRIYCPGKSSPLFANLYTDIWDDGANGTPINDENYYALYLYKMVSRYKDYVTFWEIWNEPDFDYSANAWKSKTLPNNWWTNNPDPCDYKLHTPVFHYVRMLRISYEVIKTLDPESFVALGGLGYPSFLDAVLRNTDNPKDGSKDESYPQLGGAYFDVMSFHTYPHIDGSLESRNTKNDRITYHRNSDKAVKGVIQRKRDFENVLKKYQYGFQYPQKHFIITECNIPRKAYGQYIGSEEAQRNFLIKTLVEIQKEKVKQCYVYDLADNKKQENATNEFDFMGLYQNLNTSPASPNSLAIAYKTTADLLNGYQVDFVQTRELQLSKKINGAAFFHPKTQNHVYVLWAVTSSDQSETASEFYTFPYSFHTHSMDIQNWDYSLSKKLTHLASNTIHLSGSPVFIQINKDEDAGNIPLLEVFPNPFNQVTYLQLNLEKEQIVSLDICNLKGESVTLFHENELLKSGTHQYQFKAQENSSVYLCKLKTATQTYLYKVIQLR